MIPQGPSGPCLVVNDRDQDRLRRRPARRHDIVIRLQGARWPENFRSRSSGSLVCAAAGPAARSGARTGPARRPAAAAEGRLDPRRETPHRSTPTPRRASSASAKFNTTQFIRRSSHATGHCLPLHRSKRHRRDGSAHYLIDDTSASRIDTAASVTQPRASRAARRRSLEAA